ncbi:MAG: hypothetical protein R3362_10105 [Rhodothermales bacterium]|nr:hypothetical protein [Rhodothermales bacterium]
MRRPRPARCGALLILTVIMSAAHAQDDPPAPAAPADVASIDAIVTALYDVISGPAGEERDWGRMRSLFAPDARLIPVGPTEAGGFRAVPLTVDGYVERAAPILTERGFFETEIARREERWGHIAHVFSTYAGRFGTADAEPSLRGINTIQLWHDGERWWVQNVLWQQETPETPLPPAYLPDAR